MRFCSALIVVVSAVGLPSSAHAICSSPVLCKIDQAGKRHCETFKNVCKELTPQSSGLAPQKKYSMKLNDLTLEDVQRISDLLELHIDASKFDSNH
jgi:hypothetical protein